MANTALNRSVVLILTNKSGGDLPQGATVILDSSTASAFTTTTSANQESDITGVVLEPNGITNDAVGLVAFGGYVPKINLASSANLGDYLFTHTVAGQAQPSGTKGAGAFGQVLGSGTGPAAVLWGFPVQSGSGATPVTKAIQTRTVLYDKTLASAAVLDTDNADDTGRTGVPSGYEDLEVWIDSARAVASGNTQYDALLYFNNDTTPANYRTTRITSQSGVVGGGETDTGLCGFVVGDAATTGYVTSMRIEIPLYTGTENTKNTFGKSGHRRTATQAMIAMIEHHWEVTPAAINRITLQVADVTNTFKAGTRLRIIGIKTEDVVVDVS